MSHAQVTSTVLTGGRVAHVVTNEDRIQSAEVVFYRFFTGQAPAKKSQANAVCFLCKWPNIEVQSKTVAKEAHHVLKKESIVDTMTLFHIASVIICLTALCSYLNFRFMHFPASIGQMIGALLISGVLLGLGATGWLNLREASTFIRQIDFSDILIHGMLSFLLFAGALHINWDDLKKVAWPVFILATLGVVIAVFTTGSLIWYGAGFFGFSIPYIYALLFGALISPTDPIAVLSILREMGLSRSLYVKIGSESLFNDGVGVVAFVTILSLINHPEQANFSDTAMLLARQALGGTALGVILGWGTYHLLKPIDAYRVEILLTIALAAGGYSLAEYIGVSAPICMVAAGLVIGNKGRKAGMSELSRQRLDDFWEMVDETLNAVLFLLIGFEIITISFTVPLALLGLFASVAVLIGRFISVGAIIGAMRFHSPFEKGTVRFLVWGGLRGGLSIAMALSLPHNSYNAVMIPITYITVAFSIIVQGLSFRTAMKLIK